MLAVASPCLPNVRTSNDCNTLLKELQQIWSEIGETKAEKDRMLWELERECLEVYRRKVEEMVNVKAHLHQSVAAMEVELATLMAALGEINLHSTIQAEKNSASLKERLEAITPLVEDLRRKREDRVNQFADLKSQIEKISVEMSEYMSTTSNFTTLNITDEDLSLRKLTEYQTHLLSLQSEKSERLQKVLECMNKVHSLCDVLGFDFAKTVSEVHPSLGAIDGEQRTNISNTTLDGLEKAILRLEAECKVRVQKIRLKKEQEEKEKVEAHLYTIIKVARNEDLFEQIGKEIYFDLVDHDKVRSFRVQRQTLFQQFKEEVANAFGIPVQHQRFWLWAKRQNHTYRPNRPLTPQEEGQCVGQLREVSNKANTAELKLFLEVEFGWDLQPLPIPEKSKEDILLFFKLYDPSKEDLRYIGRLFLKKNSKPAEIMAKLNEMAGFSPDEEIELFEEIMFKPSVMCERVDEGVSFCASQIGDGDIICFQKSLKMESLRQYRYPDVPSFMEYVNNWLVVRFRSLEKPKEDEFSLELSKHHNYDDVVEMVSDHLGLEDPSKIRLTSHNCYSQQPKPQPIKYRGLERLSDMLVHYNQTSDILYYEVLDIPLPELQCLKTLKVAFHHATKDEVVVHTIRLPKQSTVGDVINDLKTKVEMSHPNADLRLLEVFYHKIYKIFPLNEKIENINDQYWTLRAEEIPEEEKNLGAQDRLIHVYHFMKDPAQNQVSNFGEPFFLVIHEGETLSQIKVRIQKKLQVPDEEFAKWKFAFLSLGRPDYLEDTDVLSARFQRRDVYGAWEQYLGLEHADTTPKRAYAVNQNRHTFEKPVRIYN